MGVQSCQHSIVDSPLELAEIAVRLKLIASVPTRNCRKKMTENVDMTIVERF